MIEKSKILLIAGSVGGVSVVAVGSYLHYEYGDKYDGKSRSQWKHFKAQTDAKLKWLKYQTENRVTTIAAANDKNHEMLRIFEAYAETHPDKIDQFIETQKSCSDDTKKVFVGTTTPYQSSRNYICALYALTGKVYDRSTEYSKTPEYKELKPLLETLKAARPTTKIEQAVEQDIEKLNNASDYFQSGDFKITDKVPPEPPAPVKNSEKGKAQQ